MQNERVILHKPWLRVQHGGFQRAEPVCDGLLKSSANGDTPASRNIPAEASQGYQHCVSFCFENLTEVCSYSNQFYVSLHGRTPVCGPCAGWGSARAQQGSQRKFSGCLMTPLTSRITSVF